MTPTQVYWVMQADNICGVLGFMCAVLIGVFVISVGALTHHSLDRTWDAEKSKYVENDVTKEIGQVFALFLPLIFVFGAAYTFVPSTKTACAMWAVPIVVNNETLQADATDVYKLGMERLKDALSEKAASESKPK